LIDLAVASLAPYALLDMYAVVEIGEVRQVVDPGPLKGLVIAETEAHWFEDWRVCPNLGVARHAGFGGGNACKSALLDGGMTVAAVDAHTFDMVLVAERHGLIHRYAYFTHIIQAIDVEEDSQEGADNNECYKNAGF
jgi:hypothetical protein